MKKIILVFLLINSICYSQKIDSLKILTENDWRTYNWLNKDTVYLISIKKIDTNFVGLTKNQIIRKKRKYIYGERLSFDLNGEIEYSNKMSCPVGEPLKKIHGIELKSNQLIIDFETKKWPWKENNSERVIRNFSIIEWNSKKIILK